MTQSQIIDKHPFALLAVLAIELQVCSCRATVPQTGVAALSIGRLIAEVLQVLLSAAFPQGG